MNIRGTASDIQCIKLMGKITTIQLFKSIQTLVVQSRQELYVIANITLTETYFHIGRLIVDHEQQGSSRAGYAK